jgi:hypothetical protein
LAPVWETSFGLRIYLPNRGKGAKEEEKEEFFVTKKIILSGFFE